VQGLREKPFVSRSRKKTIQDLVGLGRKSLARFRTLSFYDVAVLVVLLSFAAMFYTFPMPELNWDAGRLGMSGVFWHDAIRNVVLTGRFDTAEEFVKMYLNQYEGDFFYYPVFWGLVCGSSFFLFGISESAFYFTVLLFALVGILATYLLASRLYDKRVGVISSLFLASSHAFLGYAKSGCIDVPAAAMVTISMFAFLKTESDERWVYPVLAGALIGLGFMTKPTTAIAVAAIALYLVLKYLRVRDKKIGSLTIFRRFQKENLRQVLRNFLIVSIPASVLFLTQMYVWARSDMISAWLYNFSGPATVVFPWYIYFSWILTEYLSPIVICLFVIGFVFCLNRKNNADVFLLTWFVIFILFVTLSSNKQPRYLFTLVPCLSIIAGQGLVSAYNLAKEKFKTRKTKLPIKNLTKTLFIMLIIMAVANGGILMRQNPYFWVDFTNIAESPYVEAAKFLVERAGVVFILPGGTYYSPPTLWFHILKYDHQRTTSFYTAAGGPWATMPNETFLAALDILSDRWDGKTVYVVIVYGFDIEGWEGLLPEHVQPLQKYVAYIESHSELIPLIKVFTRGPIMIGVYKRIKGAF